MICDWPLRRLLSPVYVRLRHHRLPLDTTLTQVPLPRFLRHRRLVLPLSQNIAHLFSESDSVRVYLLLHALGESLILRISFFSHLPKSCAFAFSHQASIFPAVGHLLQAFQIIRLLANLAKQSLVLPLVATQFILDLVQL